MKRSEMIELICDHINYHVEYYFKNGITFNNYDADSLLSRLEQLGVQPPFLKAVTSWEGGLNAPDVRIYEWEPEDV